MTKSGPRNSTCRRQKGVVALRAALLAFCILSLALMSACAKAGAAELVPDGPPLATPAPPPRVLTPVEELAEVPPPAPPAPEPVPTTPPKTAISSKPAPRPEVKVEPPAPVAAQPPAPAVTTPEPRQVSSVPSAAAAA